MLRYENNKSIRYKFLIGVILLAVAASVIAGILFVRRNTEKEGVLHNPEVDMEAMCAGQKVTWDCIYFGSYPQTEVKDTDSEYSDLQKQESWDNNGDAVINGVKYRRMLKRDATDSVEGCRYYKWDDDTTYHYFRYEPIKWRVLQNDGDKAMLLSDIALDDRHYNNGYENVTWETSTIRSWLNGYGADSNTASIDYSSRNFINSAFSSEELAALVETYVVNTDDTDGGNSTTDKVFLLSESEIYTNSAIDFGFVPEVYYDEAKICGSSDYAKAMGIWNNYAVGGSCDWWLRSPGNYEGEVAIVQDYGNVIGNYYMSGKNGVRAALNLNLSSDNLYTYAGTVCSDGIVNESSKTKKSISNPKIEYVEKIPSNGQGAKWDCIYFGSYPQTEIKEIDSEYSELQKETEWDSNGDADINGTKYRRILKSDALYVSDEETNQNNWVDDTTYRYFRYEPVKWRVLNTDGKKAMLLSDIVLDAAIYSKEEETTWEKNKLRSWLNGYGADMNQKGIDYSSNNFINIAFTEDEQSLIVETEVVNADNLRYETDGGNDTNGVNYTMDKLFLLSESEVYTKEAKEYGFSPIDFVSDVSRISDASDYAKAMGVETDEFFDNNCVWWLRSPGQQSFDTAYVMLNGVVCSDGYSSKGECNGIRVALNLKLTSKDPYKYAGAVNSKEKTDD